MRLPYFTAFVLFIIFFTIKLKLNEKKHNSIEDEFWERERRANFVRKKDIENLPYINFNPDEFPLHDEVDDPQAKSLIADLRGLSGKRILNCTGMSNTDLKLEYGTANITKLTEYDQSYTVLVRSLAKLAQVYLNTGDEALKADAVTLLEYSVKINSDVSLVYELLGKIYEQEGKYSCISELIDKAQNLNTLSKNGIVRNLNSLIPGD